MEFDEEKERRRIHQDMIRKRRLMARRRRRALFRLVFLLFFFRRITERDIVSELCSDILRQSSLSRISVDVCRLYGASASPPRTCGPAL